MPSPLICVSGERVFVFLSTQLLLESSAGPLASALLHTHTIRLRPHLGAGPQARHCLLYTFLGLKNGEPAVWLCRPQTTLETSGSLSFELGKGKKGEEAGSKSLHQCLITIKQGAGAGGTVWIHPALTT